MRKLATLTFLALTAYGGWWAWKTHQQLNDTLGQVSDLKVIVENKSKDLLGYTQYTNYVTAGKSDLSGNSKLITATVRRTEGITQVFVKSFLGLQSNAIVSISYNAEYSFGFDLSKDQYDVAQSAAGIEIRIKRPTLVATPAVTALTHRILFGGVFTNPQAAVIQLQQEASKTALANGRAMESDPAVVALCEKKLIETLHSFLAKQPGVKFVPAISVRYR